MLVTDRLGFENKGMMRVHEARKSVIVSFVGNPC
jgi:hypothetical protein